MEEKKIIYYARTYRKISTNRIKCMVYVGTLAIVAILLVLVHMDDLTLLISSIASDVLKKYNPDMHVWIRTGSYPLFGEISYLGGNTIYPGFQTSLINVVISFIMIVVLAKIPWKGRPLAIYLILNAGIHLINSLWFLFGERYFAYTVTVYSELYMLQEIGIWIMFFIMTGAVTVIVGDKGMVWKFLTVIAAMGYSVVFGTVRYIAFLYLLYRYSVIYMALFYFTLGPMFDFLYLVMIYAVFVNRMIRLYDSGKGKGAWKWS